MKDNFQDMVPVPLPTEIPQPPNLENIPLDILHSATVEMLIQQNEDLSSRLKVNIRRNSQLEQQILENKKQIQLLEQQKASVRAQNEIILEKEKLWQSQKESSGRRLETQNKEIELLEQRYNELFASNKSQAKKQQTLLSEKHQELESLQNKLKVMQQVRRRAKEKLRHFLLDVAMGLSKSQKMVDQKSASQRLLQQNFEALKNEIEEKQKFFQDQLQSFKQASQQKIHQLDLEQTALAEKNTQLMQDLKSRDHEIHAMQVKLKEEKKNRIKLSQAYEQIDKLRNENIRNKRELQSHNEKLETALDLNSESQRKLKESKDSLQKQFNEQAQALASCEKELIRISKENKEVVQQMESLKKLWLDTQERLEKEELKNSTLEKINRELGKSYDNDKVQRATESSTDSKTSGNQRRKEQLKNVYASQYRSMKTHQNLDI